MTFHFLVYGLIETDVSYNHSSTSGLHSILFGNQVEFYHSSIEMTSYLLVYGFNGKKNSFQIVQLYNRILVSFFVYEQIRHVRTKQMVLTSSTLLMNNFVMHQYSQ